MGHSGPCPSCELPPSGPTSPQLHMAQHQPHGQQHIHDDGHIEQDDDAARYQQEHL
eukprot:CAMPEP_0202915058 /NCGR_PEP_ID=MMETSP1392-20130828/64746_1 /ASSEMBLY_ACC=CAM_ASM_000868 /TAXON_ID=225041 /ORGANISM="Chlamydomonas chlamydogama, Strain SAG 11-48b" /LENGTH=55 /DNA_ID=CAMNT_0049606949 /DNA_START=754 /DNA_END=918 /DNA_ORIENTATION=+